MSGQYLASLARPGVTLEQLDAIAPTPLNVLGTANNGAGKVRLTLDATSNAYFAIAGQNFIVVQGIVGTTEANGTWLSSQITIVDATHIDITAANYVNAWVSGGQIGGSLDALGFSLDSISTSAIAKLSAVGSTSKMGFFEGSNLEAEMQTPEQDAQGQLVFCSGIRVITDCATAMVSLGSRMGPAGTVVYTDEAVVDSTGWAPQLLESRYIRAKVRMPAGAIWSFAKGVQPDGIAAGDR